MLQRKPLGHDFGKVRIYRDTSRSLQAKLVISQPGDRYEREADWVADQVMRMPEPHLQRQAAPEEEEEEEMLQTKPLIQRQVNKAVKATSEAPDSVYEALRSPGRPLDSGTRRLMESHFGYDFSQVRVHTDTQAAESANGVNALAYTVGDDIAFGREQYAPDTQTGKRLLAHELTHVIQQHRMGLRIQRANQLFPTLPLPVGFSGPPLPLNLPSACVATTMSAGVVTSSESFDVYYEKDNTDIGEITLRQRHDHDDSRILHTQSIPESPKTGKVAIPAGIPITNEKDFYELEMVFFNSKGVRYGGLGRSRPIIRFDLCQLDPAPTGDRLLFAKAIYAEGVNAGEFPYVRDVVYNRIDWVRGPCPGDERDFGDDISSVLKAKGQFASVLDNSEKFQQLETELNTHAGPCHFTTPPRSANPDVCRLINAAIQTEAAGDGNTHDYVFFRKNTALPSERAISQWCYPNGNYYWKISECPEGRARRGVFNAPPGPTIEEGLY